MLQDKLQAKKLGLEKGDTVVAKVRGDGREYYIPNRHEGHTRNEAQLGQIHTCIGGE